MMRSLETKALNSRARHYATRRLSPFPPRTLFWSFHVDPVLAIVTNQTATHTIAEPRYRQLATPLYSRSPVLTLPPSVFLPSSSVCSCTFPTLICLAPEEPGALGALGEYVWCSKSLAARVEEITYIERVESGWRLGVR